MTLDDAKRRVITRTLGDRISEKNASNQSGGSLEEDEKKRPHTPKFVQHCVTAITEKPESLERVEKKKDGSPFGICWAQYKKKRRSLAATHSKGEHHTVKQYKGALAKLRQETEELRKNRSPRSQIIFEAIGDDPKGLARRRIEFRPE